MIQQYQPETIQVVVRMKPPGFSSSMNVYYDDQTISFDQKTSFIFDHIFSHESTQEEVFNRLGINIINNVVKGYNGCIFAYGQTGSGKTHTMTGQLKSQGLIQRCLQNIWSLVQKFESFQISLSYFEIYNQTILDLLNQKQQILNVRQNVKKGFYIDKLTTHKIEHPNDFEVLIEAGMMARTTKQTKMNANSSRSHSILTLNLVTKTLQNNTVLIKSSKLNFVDLAGSQRQKLTLATGQRLKEAANINTSLAQLSLVINKLAQRASLNNSAKKNIFVPFRNSVLTKILKPSLSQNSKTIIISTIATAPQFLEESLSTLRFAQTAKNIKIYANINEQIQGNKNILNQKLKELQIKYLAEIQKCHNFQKQNQYYKLEHIRLLEIIENNSLQMQAMAQQINKYKILITQNQNILTRFDPQSQYFSIQTSQNNFNIFSQMQRNENNYKSQNNQNAKNLTIFELDQAPEVVTSQQCESFVKTNSFFTINEVGQKQEYDDSPQKIKKVFQNSPYKITKGRLELKISELQQQLKTKDLRIQEFIVRLKLKSDYDERYQKMFDQYQKNYQMRNYPEAQKKILFGSILKANQLQKELELQKNLRQVQTERFQMHLAKIKADINSFSVGNMRLTQIKQEIKYKMNLANQVKSVQNVKQSKNSQNYLTQLNPPISQVIKKNSYSSQSIQDKSNFEAQIKLKVEIDKLKRQLRSVKDESDRFKVLNQLDVAKISIIQSEVLQLKLRNDLLEQDLSQKLKELEKIKTQNHEIMLLKEQIEKLLVKIESYQIQKLQTKQKIQRMNTMEIQVQNLRRSNKNIDKMVQNYQNQLKEANQQYKKINQKYRNEEMQNKILLQELNQMKLLQMENHKQLMSSYQMSKNRQQQLIKHYDGRTQDLQLWMKEKQNQFNKQLEQKDKLIADLTEQNANHKRISNETKNHVKNINSKSSKIMQYEESLKSQEIKQLIGKIQFLQMKHEAQSNTYRRKVKQLQMTLQNQNSKERALVNQLTTQKNQFQQIELVYEEKIKSLAACHQSQRNKLTSQSKKYQKKYKQIIQKCEMMNQQNQFLNKQLSQKKRSIEGLKNKINILQKERSKYVQNQSESVEFNNSKGRGISNSRQYNNENNNKTFNFQKSSSTNNGNGNGNESYFQSFQSSNLSYQSQNQIQKLYDVIDKCKEQNQILKEELYEKDQLLKKKDQKIDHFKTSYQRVLVQLQKQVRINDNEKEKKIEFKRQTLTYKQECLVHRQNAILQKEKYQTLKRKYQTLESQVKQLQIQRMLKTNNSIENKANESLALQQHYNEENQQEKSVQE